MKLAVIIIVCIVLVCLILYSGFNYLTTKGVKTPAYKILQKDKNIEIREYAPMLIATVKVKGDRKEAISNGFKMLADFIFGNNTANNSKSEKISMTAPVIQSASEKISMTAPVLQQKSDNNEWTVEFVMPAKYTMQSLPKPNNKSIDIQEVPARKVIAIRFSGTGSDSNIEKYNQILIAYIMAHKIDVISGPEYAFYNPPWTIPSQRRNEVLYVIK